MPASPPTRAATNAAAMAARLLEVMSIPPADGRARAHVTRPLTAMSRNRQAHARARPSHCQIPVNTSKRTVPRRRGAAVNSDGRWLVLAPPNAARRPPARLVARRHGSRHRGPPTSSSSAFCAARRSNKSDRLKRFLMFIVRETAAGRGAQLKEYVIGVQVFRKEDSFDPRTDPIVRVQARRLRAKLVRYYRDEGRADPTLIELPKGGYTPVIKRRDEPASPQTVGRHRAGQPQHDRGAAVCGSQRRRVARRRSARACARKSCITWRGSPGLRILAALAGPRRADRCAEAATRGAALVITAASANPASGCGSRCT